MYRTGDLGRYLSDGGLEYMGRNDFQVKIRDHALQSRAHPSLRTRVGEPIYLRIDPEKCLALRATGEWAPGK